MGLGIPQTTDTRRLNLKIFVGQIQIPLPNKYLGVGYKGLVFCINNSWIMENMKELTVRTKMGAMPQQISAQKFEIFKKRALSECL